MDTMTTMARGRDFTREELDALSDDGWRHELVDGSLVTTPAPGYRHQDVVGRLHLLLQAACPRDLPAAPVLAVEVLSPSTHHLDLGLDLRRYETAGCPSYWDVDPGTGQQAPSLWAWELHHGQDVEVAHVSGDQECRLELPYPVTVVPTTLRD